MNQHASHHSLRIRHALLGVARALAALTLFTPTCRLVAAEPHPSRRPSPPNVIYLLVDDLGRADCGFAGGKEIKTPHIDELAAAGCTLDAYYVQPLCSPTRAALLTGRYPMRYGLQVGVVRPWAQYGLPLNEKTLADDLQTAGYATGIFGKWHLGHFAPEYLPRRRGFTQQYGHYNGAIDYFTHVRDGGLDWHRDDRPLEEPGYSTKLIGRHAAEFVRTHAGRKPFFLYVPFNAVHAPYQPPRRPADEYASLRGKRRQYAQMLVATDEAVGEIVAAVDEAGVRNSTLIIFSSDNGGPSPGRITDNGQLRGGKGGLYEGGVCVAAFVAWPGHIPALSTNSQPMHVVDWRPTLQKLCGAEPTGDVSLDGRDLWPTLASGAPSPHNAILLNTTPQDGALRAGDWKLIVHNRTIDGSKDTRAESIELYNLRTDPSEQDNVAADHPAKVDELKSTLAKYAAEAAPPKSTPRPKNFTAPRIWGDFGS